MTYYRRIRIPGGCYFFTLVTHQRRPIFADPGNVEFLRQAFRIVMSDRPFEIDAMVVLPDHLHTIWRLPPGDSDFSTRWRLIKYRFSLACKDFGEISASLSRRREKGVWQRRFWEHALRDEEDWQRHVDYIHYNPVKHGLCGRPSDWQFSSFRRFVEKGHYPLDWGEKGIDMDLGVAGE